MKKIFLSISVFSLFLLNACSGGCDASTADGAAQCMCDLIKEYVNAKNDDAKSKEIDERFDRLEEVVEKNIETGKYSESDLEKAMSDKKCEK